MDNFKPFYTSMADSVLHLHTLSCTAHSIDLSTANVCNVQVINLHEKDPQKLRGALDQLKSKVPENFPFSEGVGQSGTHDQL